LIFKLEQLFVFLCSFNYSLSDTNFHLERGMFIELFETSDCFFKLMHSSSQESRQMKACIL